MKSIDSRLLNCLGMVAGLLLACISQGHAQSQGGKISVPPASRQAEIKSLLEETYGVKKADTAAKKEQLAQTMKEAIDGGELSSDELYVTTTTLISLHRDGDRFAPYWDAVESLADKYELDADDWKTKSLRDFLKDSKESESLKQAIAEALSVANVAAHENSFANAMAILTAAETANRRLSAASSSKQQLADAKKAVSGREAQWKAFQKATAVLMKSPDDAESNWNSGRWHAVYEDDWSVALPLLVKGNNQRWKAASISELGTSAENAAQIAVADAWWNIGQAESSEAKTAVLKHAAEWYELALPGTTSLQKVRIERRLSEIGEPAVVAVSKSNPKVKSKPRIPAAAYLDPVEIPNGGVNFAGMATTRFADWNADGEPDLLVGSGDGYVWLLLNSGKGKLGLPKRVPVSGGELRVGTSEITVCMADMNGDSKLDLVVAHSNNQVALIENSGTTKAPRFEGARTLPTVSGEPLKLLELCHGRMGLGDWDGDGDIDLLSGGYDNPITCYRNVGTAKAPKFADGKPLAGEGVLDKYPHNASPMIYDVNQDGVPDIVYGMNWGSILFLFGSKPTATLKPLEPGMPTIRGLVSAKTVAGNDINLRAIIRDNATPTIADLDGDGVLDIVSGGANGKLWFLRGVVATQPK